MKKLIALLMTMVLLMSSVPAFADFTAAENLRRCVECIEEAGYSYTADEEKNYLYVDFALDDSSFSPDGGTLWMFAYSDGVAIDLDFSTHVPEDRIGEMLTFVSLINPFSSEGFFCVDPDNGRLGVSNYCYSVDRLPSIKLLDYYISGLFMRLMSFDAQIAQVAAGESAWDVYNAFLAEIE